MFGLPWSFNNKDLENLKKYTPPIKCNEKGKRWKHIPKYRKFVLRTNEISTLSANL